VLTLILRAILIFLIAHTVLRVVRALRVLPGRDVLPRQPHPDSSPPEIDPSDIIEGTYREVKDRPAG
jgi:hypothetical protein